MKNDPTRRNFIAKGSAAMAGLLAAGAVPAARGSEDSTQSPPANTAAEQDASSSAQSEDQKHSAQHERHSDYPRRHAGPGGPLGSDTDRGKLVSGYRSADEPPVSVVMPNLEPLPWEMKDGAKEFHLVAEHVRREILPEMYFDVWGYNGSMPGPMIEAVEGDRVRIVVHNKLPEATTVHWHGLELPVAMDGVPGLTQEPIPPGGKFVYEFDLHQHGTFFYHSHGPMQEIMGMMGLFVIHPRQAFTPTVDHDFGLIMQEFAILPQSLASARRASRMLSRYSS